MMTTHIPHFDYFPRSVRFKTIVGGVVFDLTRGGVLFINGVGVQFIVAQESLDTLQRDVGL